MKKILILLGILLMPYLAHAQAEKYKSMFTLNFVRYVGWPEDTKQGDFIIGVLKGGAVANLLKTQAAGKKFGFQNVVIKEFKSPDEITNCQVIYVSSSVNFSKYADVIKQKCGNGKTLIITESEGATKHGSMINFVIREDKLKFEIHKTNADAFGLSISSKLGSMASAINL